MRFAILLSIAAGICIAEKTAADDLTVFTADDARAAAQGMMSRYLKAKAYRALDDRAAAYETIKTADDVKQYQQRMRAEFTTRLGGFPARTPLQPKVVGRLDGDGYRIEKLIYESQPRHYVTALLYLPHGKGPFPAVVVPSGHSRSGKAAGYNQRVCILLAKYGIAALAYDPIGQGERSQLLDEAGKPRFGTTTEHTLVGASCIPLGRNTATFRIWDGMRSIDYLCSRKDIDATKIGVTGCSGGGTLSSYLMALDDRVACAAPSCYLTSFRRLIDTIGPQDAEQNIFGQIGVGMDHADYVMMRAPKPTLILASTHDFFDIDGTWQTFREAKRFYARLGLSERVSLVEIDAKHGIPKEQREPMVRWMRRWLLGIDEPVTEPEFDVWTEEELHCTPRGQVMLLEDARSVMDLNVERMKQLTKTRRDRKLWSPENRDESLEAVRRLAGIRKLAEIPEADVTIEGLVERDGYRMAKLLFRLKPEKILLPALIAEPRKLTGDRILYLHGGGKHADAMPGGEIEKLVLAGNMVLAVDLRGSGETGPAKANQWGGDWDDIFLSYLLGDSLLGMRAEDTLIALRFLSSYDRDGEPAKVRVHAIGTAAPPAIHAATLESELVASLQLSNTIHSWEQLIRQPDLKRQLVNTVHGALRVYDLQDLVQSLPIEVTFDPSPAPSP